AAQVTLVDRTGRTNGHVGRLGAPRLQAPRQALVAHRIALALDVARRLLDDLRRRIAPRRLLVNHPQPELHLAAPARRRRRLLRGCTTLLDDDRRTRGEHHLVPARTTQRLSGRPAHAGAVRGDSRVPQVFHHIPLIRAQGIRPVASTILHAIQVESDFVHRHAVRSARGTGNRARAHGERDAQLVCAILLGVARIEEVERLAGLPRRTGCVERGAAALRGRGRAVTLLQEVELPVAHKRVGLHRKPGRRNRQERRQPTGDRPSCRPDLGNLHRSVLPFALLVNYSLVPAVPAALPGAGSGLPASGYTVPTRSLVRPAACEVGDRVPFPPGSRREPAGATAVPLASA